MKDDLNKKLQQISQDVADKADDIMEKIRDWQIIKNYLSNRIKDLVLTPEQEKKLLRYQYIYNQQVSGRYTDQEIVAQVKKIYGVEISQAYEDINHSREIFNSVINVHKQFELKLQLQVNRKMMNKAAELGDMDAYSKIEKNRIYLIKQLHEEPEDLAQFFEGHIYELSFDPALLGGPKVNMAKVLNAINAKRSKKIKTDMFEELDSKDVDD
ncbi:MAG TPA: hypothetical protein VHA52_13345 [Candidatus Babeliaceae bacterium]|nr:hypothetical protein [Candidatus Babeliaceae bacterium]HVZ98562.1 hypothetical protein [Chitinophagaceae bacterium]